MAWLDGIVAALGSLGLLIGIGLNWYGLGKWYPSVWKQPCERTER